MADKDLSKGPKEDSDWFASNGTVQQMSDAVSAIKGAGSSNAMDRIASIVKLFAMLGGG